MLAVISVQPGRIFAKVTQSVLLGVTLVTLSALPVEMPKEIADKFLPASDYERAKAVDWAKAQAAQKGFSERYLSEVR